MAADSDEQAKELKSVRSIVRSLLISSGEGVAKHKLLSDYKKFIGSPMPLRELGYRSLDHFVYQNSDVIREAIARTGDEVYVAVVDSSTQHIAKLIANQKKPTLKKAKAKLSSSFPSYKSPSHYVPPSRKYTSKIGKCSCCNTHDYV